MEKENFNLEDKNDLELTESDLELVNEEEIRGGDSKEEGVEKKEKEISEEERNLNALEEQRRSIQNKEIGKKRKTLERIRQVVGSAIILGSSFLGSGCSEEGGPKLENEREKIERVEEERHEAGSYELLGKILNKISGGLDAQSGEETWVYRIRDGRFFEIKLGDDYGKLADFVTINYKEPTNENLKTRGTLELKKIERITDKVEQIITQIGKEVSYRDIPEELKRFEQARKESARQMERGSIIQNY